MCPESSKQAWKRQFSPCGDLVKTAAGDRVLRSGEESCAEES